MLAEILLVAGKDLRVESRSRVAINQVAPFAILVLVMFGFALEGDRATLSNFTPGLYWVTILLASILAIHRSVAIEAGDGAREGLLLTGLRPASVFLGKTVALIAQLLIVAIVLLGGVAVFYDARIDDAFLLVVSLIGAVVGIAAAGTLYGALLGGQRARETVLPILILPVLSPVLIGASRAFGDAMGTVAADGWAWTSLLFGFGAVYLAMGVASHGVLMEEN
ncbi:MAG: heme exporter protein B [Verrucomicrobiales bacterium]|jgi:heme exporter protein B